MNQGTLHRYFRFEHTDRSGYTLPQPSNHAILIPVLSVERNHYDSDVSLATTLQGVQLIDMILHGEFTCSSSLGSDIFKYRTSTFSPIRHEASILKKCTYLRRTGVSRIRSTITDS